MFNQTMQFEVLGYDFSKRAGKSPKYKVILQNSDGHKMTLLSDTKKIYEEFPIGETVTVKIAQSQSTLDLPSEA